MEVQRELEPRHQRALMVQDHLGRHEVVQMKVQKIDIEEEVQPMQQTFNKNKRRKKSMQEKEEV